MTLLTTRERWGRLRGWYARGAQSEPEPGPQIVAGPTVTGVTETSATIRWDLSVPCTGQVEYGTDPGLAGASFSTLETNLLLFHIQTIGDDEPDLTPATTYYYRVRSVAEDGQPVLSAIGSFTTAGAAPTGPTISNVTISAVSQTGATVSWSVAPDADGFIEYGSTTAYGNSTAFEPSLLPAHSQAISGLSPGTTYFFRIRSSDAASAESTHEGQFTTQSSGGGSGGGTPLVFGNGVRADGRSNTILRNFASGSGGYSGLAFPFIARHSAAIAKVYFQPRFGSGYSSGNGGEHTVSIYACTADGTPTGSALASEAWVPGNSGSGGRIFDLTFSSPYTATAGQLLALVFEPSTSSQTNYVSVNGLIVRNPGSDGSGFGRFQPGFPDTVRPRRRSEGSSTWNVWSGHIGNFDIEYATAGVGGDGFAHDGCLFIGAEVGTWGLIGGSNRVREEFTPFQPEIVTGAWMRIGRQSGSGAVTLQLKTISGAAASGGSVVRTVTIPGSALTLNWTLGSTGPSTQNGIWVGGTFASPVTLQASQRYALEASAPSGSQYSMVNLLRSDSTNGSDYMYSHPFPEADYRIGRGGAYDSTNGGSSWSLFQGHPGNCQMYLTL